MDTRKYAVVAVFALLAVIGLYGCSGKSEQPTVPRNTVNVSDVPAGVKREGAGAVADTTAVPAPPGVQTGNMAGGRK